MTGAPNAESVRCTGLTARWCPVHGDCICAAEEAAGDSFDLDSPRCALHSFLSPHPAQIDGSGATS